MIRVGFFILIGSLLAVTNVHAAVGNGKPKILMAVTNNSILGDSQTPTGLHLSELTHPYFAFQEAGFEVHLVSPRGGHSPVDPGSINDEDPANSRFWDNPEYRTLLDSTLSAASVNPSEYAGIFFVGGHGTMWDFPENLNLSRIASEVYEHNGIVGAICHGPAGLLNIKLSNGSYLIAGKELTALSNAEEDIGGRLPLMPFLLETELVNRGATFSRMAPWQSHVVVSERLLTAQNPQSVAEATRKFIELIKLQH